MELLGNLLNQALSIIPKQSGLIHREGSRTKNARGQWITSFDAPVTISGSFQAVPREKLELLGLDLKKVYLMLFTSEDATGLKRGERGDQIEFEGSFYQLVVEGGWKAIDDWSGILMVQVPNDG